MGGLWRLEIRIGETESFAAVASLLEQLVYHPLVLGNIKSP